ncbi:hypothetical protein [Sphingobium yanoikuyae]|uniref:hypothetical protein n=1 Tax=Sphingobium yanoikuyae TaxID=13690 RepID=UPI00242C9F94|nr:hypothetical protein [Sphingobium yanoikuyae]
MTAFVVALLDEELGASIDAMAEAMWQSESHRCMGKSRLVPWSEAGADVQAKWCQLAVAALGALTGKSPWRSMEGAPRDGSVIWACTFTDLPEEIAGSRYVNGWRGRWIAIRHIGFAGGEDLGWAVAAPAGIPCMTDDWFVGWMPTAPIPADATSRMRVAEPT